MGPGSVLRDLIDSGAVPKVVLRRIFRQDRESLIVVNAHRILQGGRWSGATARTGATSFLSRANPKKRFSPRSRNSCAKASRVRLSLDAQEVAQTIQVLTPMHRGLVGHDQFESRAAGPAQSDGRDPSNAAALRCAPATRSCSCAIIMTREFSTATSAGSPPSTGRTARFKVDFFDKLVAYDSDELDEIGLAYATSVHKSQGSEYPAVVIPLHTSHYLLLHRSILYTAVTRGKKLVVLVGSKRALAMAIRNLRVEQRNTGLKEKLAELRKTASRSGLMLIGTSRPELIR